MRVQSAAGRRRRGLVWPTALALVATAVVPVLAVGLIQRAGQQEALTDRAVADLHVIADVQRARLAGVVAAANDHVQLVRSRTQMGADLAAVVAGDPTPVARLQQIIEDAAAASTTVTSISLTDTSGATIATTDPRLASREFAHVARLDLADPSLSVPIVEHASAPEWFLLAPVVHVGVPVGAAVIGLEVETLLPLDEADHAHEHGMTTCVFARTTDGDLVDLAAVSDEAARVCESFARAAPSVDALGRRATLPLATRALDGEQHDFREVAHADATFVAATRPVDAAGWGLVVAIDRDAYLAPVATMAQRLAMATVALAVIAVLAAVAIAHWLTAPIRALRDAAAAFGRDGPATVADVDAPGELGELAVSFNELTDRVRAEQRAARRRYDDLELLTHAMAHDLKGPLTNVRGMIETLASDRVTDEAQRAQLLDRAHTGAIRMQRQIDDLLALIRSVGKPSSATDVDLAALVTDVVGQLGLGDAVRVDQLPVVSGDPVLLERLVLNLVDNAAKYHAAGETPVTHVHADLSATDVTIHVDDAGVGIPESRRAAVVDAFERGTATPGVGGTGLGLSIVAKVVAHHGGALAITDSPLGGTRVSVTLPLTTRPAAP